MGGSPQPNDASYTPVPLEEAVPQETQKVEVITTASPSAEEQVLIRKASNGLLFVCFVQLLWGFLFLFSGGFLVSLCILLFASMGISGVRKLRADHLTAHFVFTFVVYILSLFALVMLFLYDYNLPLAAVLLLGVWIFVQVLGLKSSRILLGIVRKYKDAGLPLVQKSCCSNKNYCAVPKQDAAPAAIPPSYSDFVAAHPQQQPMTYVTMQPVASNNNAFMYPQQFALPPYMIVQPNAEIDLCGSEQPSHIYPGTQSRN